MWGLQQKQNARRADKIRLYGHLRRYKKIVKKTYIISEINTYIAAEHDGTAKGWIESRGFRYLCASSQEEFDEKLQEFLKEDSETPILFEVFTLKDEDAKIVHTYYDANTALNIKNETKKIVRKLMGKSKSLDVAINKARKKF